MPHPPSSLNATRMAVAHRRPHARAKLRQVCIHDGTLAPRRARRSEICFPHLDLVS